MRRTSVRRVEVTREWAANNREWIESHSAAPVEAGEPLSQTVVVTLNLPMTVSGAFDQRTYRKLTLPRRILCGGERAKGFRYEGGM